MQYVFPLFVLLMLLITVPRLFTTWWLYWSEQKPDDFPLPPVLAQFSDFSLQDEGDDTTSLLVDDNEETELGRVVTIAWHSIPVVDRNLMLFCWAARQAEKVVHDRITHPTVSVAEAKVFLIEDMSELQGLHDRAIVVVERSKLFVKDL